jgi:uncharacterized membrane protein
VGIYWNNHHHMLQTVKQVRGSILWANLHLLFWLSLFPFASGWMGENHFAAMPSALYGLVLLMAAIAYTILQKTIIASQEENSLLAKVVGRDIKGKLSSLLYIVGIIAAFYSPILSGLIYAAVALMWLIPDRRIERVIGN